MQEKGVSKIEKKNKSKEGRETDCIINYYIHKAKTT